MSTLARRAAAPILLAAMLAAGHAQAETRTVGGAQFVLSTSLSDDVVIDTDPSLHGQIRLSRDSGLSCLAVAGGYTVAISTSRCDDDSGGLRIDVPPDAPLTLSSSGDGNIHVADLRGPLTVSLSGSGDLVAGRTGPLVLSVRASGEASVGDVDGPAAIDMNGSGDVHIKDLHGPLTLKQVGSGDLVAGGIQAGAAVIDANGSGDILLGAGHIDDLHARLSGSGGLSVAASMRDADVSASGGGDVKLGPISGTLNQNASDGSGVVVLDARHAHAIADEVARKFGARGTSSGGGTHVSLNFPPVLENLLTAIFAGLVLYICWRIVRRAGGLSGLRRSASATPAAPTNPGVLALGETMSRLEQRLGRLESYVTTREFDLTRKFRDLGSS